MPSPFSFQPPTGGNVVLKSCEGTVFNAHSVVLGLASTVFAGMFSGASSPNTIELAEDAETISLMLAFIYPVAPPKIATAAQLEKVMIFSQKYGIAKMIDIVEKSIPPESKLIHSDPIQVFRASVKYGFPTLRVFAGRALGASQRRRLRLELSEHRRFDSVYCLGSYPRSGSLEPSKLISQTVTTISHVWRVVAAGIKHANLMADIPQAGFEAGLEWLNPDLLPNQCINAKMLSAFYGF
ncbi:The BTB (BR-C, ttk and bab)/POZ (Pox virus and Zinc finger) domain [Rhizoctonia solani]|uniref:The BTB (BR-C, ttk and bab)/POZ (Pox virus and Zinc finger) domain n=1 Tax=Rhizoctonia solani TaxID=456999 RepID=A0A8H8PAX4_9AGAM|nr:The BTB (BR-C, ttk and bab)/POZ (Pox virus and Zinc finger) domain [Rhizoctonia solani]QRW26933.1 The BTB (BR-C, ttk and bab)/POZ (Pox virus and Zinc finger) domain [Rhizoctonia solani]